MFPLIINPILALKVLDNRHTQALYILTNQNRTYLKNWLPWLDAVTIEQHTKDFIQQTLIGYVDTGCFVCGIWFEGKICGVIGYNSIDWQNKIAYLGYWLGEDFQGKGIMTESCQALIQHAFDEYQLTQIKINCAEMNLKSQAIPRRLGFAEGELVPNAEWLYDHYVDHRVFTLTTDI